MSTTYLVNCIKRASSQPGVNPVIQSLSGPNWTKPATEVVTDIQNNVCGYHVMIGLRQVPLVIAECHGIPCLKTMLDGPTPDNIFALPECH